MTRLIDLLNEAKKGIRVFEENGFSDRNTTIQDVYIWKKAQFVAYQKAVNAVESDMREYFDKIRRNY